MGYSGLFPIGNL